MAETRSHQLRLNSQPAYCATHTRLTAKAASGGLSGCFQIFVKLKSISIKV